MTTQSSELQTLIATRRDLHRNPELGFEEHRTAGIVAERLRSAGYDVRTGVAVTGVIGTLKGGAGDGPTLMLRADMDALPIQEENTHEFVSRAPGKMHACGHDAHVAIALAVAERLAARREELRGEVRYVFQPAEEGMGGARQMVEQGALDGVDAALGLHIWTPMPRGTVGVVDGPQMAGSQEFRIEVHGRGGHGAMPDQTVDAAVVASHIVVALQTVVSRNVAPLNGAVVSVGSLHAGSAMNVIAADAVLEGTIRAFRPEVLELVRERVTTIAEGVGGSLEAEVVVKFADLLFPPTANSPELAQLVREAAAEVVGDEKVDSRPEVRTMAAEDFSEFATRVPGCYFFLGTGDAAAGSDHPHHSPLFDICEDVLPIGVEILERSAVAYLNGDR